MTALGAMLVLPAIVASDATGASLGSCMGGLLLLALLGALAAP